MDSKLRSAKNNSSGFTLVELIVAGLISVIISGLMFDNFIRVIQQAKTDREKISTTITLTGVLQQVSDDLKMAGENIPEDNFPAITFNATPKTIVKTVFDNWNVTSPASGANTSTVTRIETNRIIIRRSILKPLTLCQNIPSGEAIGNYTFGFRTNAIVVATDDKSIADPGCRTTPLQSDAATPILTESLRAERNYRCKSAIAIDPTTSDGCFARTSANNSHPVSPVLLMNKTGDYHNFRIYDEISNAIAQGSQYGILVSTEFSPEGEISSAQYPIGSPIYIVEEREYVLDNSGNINLYVNGLKIIAVASNIERFNVSARLLLNRNTKTNQVNPANPCATDTRYTCIFNSSNGDRWKDISSVKIEIQKKYNPIGGGSPTQLDLDNLTASSEFILNNK